MPCAKMFPRTLDLAAPSRLTSQPRPGRAQVLAFRPRPGLPPSILPPKSSSGTRKALRIRAVGWDPEGILAAPQPGHIARRKMQRQLGHEEEEAQRAEAEQAKEKEKRERRRQSRIVPESDSELVDFLLTVEREEGAQEVEFEVARCGPRVTSAAFLNALHGSLGTIRFATRQSEEDLQRLQSLERLEKLVKEHADAQESLRLAVSGAKERLQALLSAKDKREKILAMAAAGELDLSLLALLDENIVAAQEAKQKDAVDFMEKVRGAVVKYMPKDQLTY